MRFFVDTNVLLYAVNTDAPEHGPAKSFLDQCFKDRISWAMSWNVAYEFLRVATHPRVFKNPISAADATAIISTLHATDLVSFLVPTERHASLLEQTLAELHSPAGNIFHDIHTAVVLREHGIREIYTADTDFLQFPFLKVLNPLKK